MTAANKDKRRTVVSRLQPRRIDPRAPAVPHPASPSSRTALLGGGLLASEAFTMPRRLD
jgi:hypothetical protein